MKLNQIAKDVRIVLNDNFEPRNLGEEYLIKDPIKWIADGHIYNDEIGEYVRIKGYTKSEDGAVFINNGIAYLSQIDLEFPIEY